MMTIKAEIIAFFRDCERRAARHRIRKREIEGFEYWAFERNGEWFPSQSLFHALLGIASPGMNMVIQSRMYLNATEFNEGVEMMGGVTVADLLEADGNKSDKIREQKDDPK